MKAVKAMKPNRKVIKKSNTLPSKDEKDPGHAEEG